MAKQNQASRRETQLLLLKRNGFMSIGELAKQCVVSEMTMRRDLRCLAKENKVRLVYGGATYVRNENEPDFYSLLNEKDRNKAKKLAIARAAAKLIQPHDVVLFDSGSTVQQLADQLVDDKPHTYLCYSVNIFETILPLTNSRIIMTGGTFNRTSLLVNGPEALPTLQRYRINKFFFGAGGLHLRMGLTCNSEDAVPIKRAIFPNCLENILLFDSSKFERVTSYHLSELENVTMIITDNGIPQEYIDYIQSKKVTLIITDPEEVK